MKSHRRVLNTEGFKVPIDIYKRFQLPLVTRHGLSERKAGRLGLGGCSSWGALAPADISPPSRPQGSGPRERMALTSMPWPAPVMASCWLQLMILAKSTCLATHAVSLE